MAGSSLKLAKFGRSDLPTPAVPSFFILRHAPLHKPLALATREGKRTQQRARQIPHRNEFHDWLTAAANAATTYVILT